MKRNDSNHVVRAAQKRLERLEIVARLYRRGGSMRAIAAGLKAELHETVSLSRVHAYVLELLAEWKATRIEDTGLAVQGQLEQIDYIITELWEQWDKSKQDHILRFTTRKGGVYKQGQHTLFAELRTGERMNVRLMEETEKQVVNVGDVRIIAEIRAHQIERRKLLGLYAPEKIDARLALGAINLTAEDVAEYRKTFLEEY